MKQLLYRTFKPFPYVVWYCAMFVVLPSILFWSPFEYYWAVVYTSYCTVPFLRLWLYG